MVGLIHSKRVCRLRTLKHTTRTAEPASALRVLLPRKHKCADPFDGLCDAFHPGSIQRSVALASRPAGTTAVAAAAVVGSTPDAHVLCHSRRLGGTWQRRIGGRAIAIGVIDVGVWSGSADEGGGRAVGSEEGCHAHAQAKKSAEGDHVRLPTQSQ